MEIICAGAVGLAVIAFGMNLPRLWIVALLLTSVSIPRVVAAPPADSPGTVVQDLYRSSLTHFTGFSPDSVKLTKPWVTPKLYARLLKKASEPQAKDAAPDIEGDIFLDSQEPPTRFEIGQNSVNQTKASVDVVLFWAHETRHYVVQLKLVDGAWKVADVNFGKDGKLTDLLQ
jgi:hypothetical protein